MRSLILAACLALPLISFAGSETVDIPVECMSNAAAAAAFDKHGESPVILGRSTLYEEFDLGFFMNPKATDYTIVVVHQKKKVTCVLDYGKIRKVLPLKQPTI